jgi:hypothetical protein
MPNIPFEEAAEYKEEIDDSIFVNDEDTKLYFEKYIYCQNYLSTQYIGRAPLEFYTNDGYTNMGREFVLICREGIPTEDYRAFGTEAAIRGYNRNASENVKLPGGGD